MLGRDRIGWLEDQVSPFRCANCGSPLDGEYVLTIADDNVQALRGPARTLFVAP